MLELMRDVLDSRMLMEHRDDGGVIMFTSRAWRRLFNIRGPLVKELILEFHSTLRFGEVLLDLDSPDGVPGFSRYWSESERMIPGKGDLRDYWRSISTDGDFLGPPPSYTLIRDPVLRLYHKMMAHSIAGSSQAPKKVTVTALFYWGGLDVGSVNIPYLLARYLRRFAARRKNGDLISEELPVIDMAELPDVAAGAPEVAEDAPVIDEGGQVFRHPCRHLSSQHHHLLRVGLCLRDWGDLRRSSWRLADRHFRHSMGPFGGAHLQHSRDAPGRGLARPTPP
ncbi:hypothetical protein Tco_1465242 [Tanacetum coccineum]